MISIFQILLIPSYLAQRQPRTSASANRRRPATTTHASKAGALPHTLRFEPRTSKTSGLFVACLTKSSSST